MTARLRAIAMLVGLAVLVGCQQVTVYPPTAAPIVQPVETQPTVGEQPAGETRTEVKIEEKTETKTKTEIIDPGD